jgi:hypothetical protein
MLTAGPATVSTRAQLRRVFVKFPLQVLRREWLNCRLRRHEVHLLFTRSKTTHGHVQKRDARLQIRVEVFRRIVAWSFCRRLTRRFRLALRLKMVSGFPMNEGDFRV